MKKNYSLLALLGLSLLLSGCFRTRADIAREKEEREAKAAAYQAQLDAQQNAEKLQAELGRLQGKIEELEHQRRKEMSSVSSNTEGNAKSVAEMKNSLEEMKKSQAVLFDEIKRLREENLELLKNSKPARAAPLALSPGEAKKGGGYNSAVTAYKAKDYDAAINGFRAYLANPKAKKAQDARFLLADSLYKRKEYQEAIVEFGSVQEKAPTSALGRKSTLKIAESFKALGKDKDARSFAQLLISTSPNSAEAKQARKFLK
jgi:TolA-binding protein